MRANGEADADSLLAGAFEGRWSSGTEGNSPGTPVVGYSALTRSIFTVKLWLTL